MEKTEKQGVRAFLDKKGITLSPKVYFIDAMGSMALGLFATLLMGTIFSTIAGWIPEGNIISEFFKNMSSYASGATGVVLGVAIAYSLKAHPLVVFSAGVVGMIGNNLPTVIEGVAKPVTAGPLGAFLCVLVAVEVAKLVSKATKVDILVTPAVTIAVGTLLAMLLCPGIAYVLRIVVDDRCAHGKYLYADDNAEHRDNSTVKLAVGILQDVFNEEAGGKIRCPNTQRRHRNERKQGNGEIHFIL